MQSTTTTQQARRRALCAIRPTPTEDASASERRACARTCDDACRHADDRRPTTAGAAPDEHGERASANARATTLYPPSIQTSAAAHDAIDAPRRYEHQRAQSTHTHTHARRSHSSLPMTARSAEALPQRAASTTSLRARAPAPTHRDAALLIETRPTIPRESRDCERRACAQSNKLATGSKRERRCGECDERERDKARASRTAPHDKDRHSPRRRNEQGERRATSVRPLALNNKRPAHTSGSRWEREVREAWAPAIPNQPHHPTTNSHARARALSSSHSSTSPNRTVSSRRRGPRQQSPSPHQKQQRNARRNPKRTRKKRATVSDNRARARQRERSKIDDDRCKHRPRPQNVRERGAHCHCIAVRTCEAHGHRHTNASAPVRLQAGTHEATIRTRDRQRITTMHPERPMHANRSLLSPPPPHI
jgi:hypothetical protein